MMSVMAEINGIAFMAIFRRTVLMSLCVSDPIKHTEAVTGATVSQLGGLRPLAAHGADYPAPKPPCQEQCGWHWILQIGELRSQASEIWRQSFA
jgi:hypothetical protein